MARSEYEIYYSEFVQPKVWAHPDPDLCGCRGSGWWLSEVDTWEHCPHHGKGVPHPEEYIPTEEELAAIPDLEQEDPTAIPPSFGDDDIPF